MAHRWHPCSAIILIEGRGAIRCWLPPQPGDSGFCVHHDPTQAAIAPERLRRLMVSLVREVDPEAQLTELTELPEAAYGLRVEIPGEIAKSLVVPRAVLEAAIDQESARRGLRNLLATIVMIQRAQLALGRSRELLADTARTARNHAPPAW